MTDLTQRLPVELLAEILEHVPALDILGFKLVNRVFRDVILSSPLIQHKLDLHAVGLEHNSVAGINLAESRKALSQYLTLDTLSPMKEWMVDDLRVPDDLEDATTAGGVYAIMNDKVRLFTLGSVSRGIPYKQWTIPLPDIVPENYGFYPDADVIAFVELLRLIDVEIVICLRTLSSGGFHPASRCREITYSRKDGIIAHHIPFVSISGSRLVLLISMEHTVRMVIWDWRSAQFLFSLENVHYDSAEFIDDYRLFVNLRASGDRLPCILLIDTEKDVGGAPAQTSFQFTPYFRDTGYPSLHLERGVHKPSHAERLAPFHHDPTQRIAALFMPYTYDCLVFPVEALVRLAEDREGCEIGWDEWKKHVVIPSVNQINLVEVWVSGCRLFCITSAGHGAEAQMEVYDFSKKGRVKYLSEQVNPDLDGVRYLSSTGAKAKLPWDIDDLLDMNGGHDSVVFFRMLKDPPEDGRDEAEGALHMWTF